MAEYDQKNGLDLHAQTLILNEVQQSSQKLETMAHNQDRIVTAIETQTKVIQNHVLTAKDLNAFLIKLVLSFAAVIGSITAALKYLQP